MQIDHKNFIAFENQYGADMAEEVLERICDAQYKREGEGVHFLDIFQHNVCNHTLSGTIDVGAEQFGFVIDNGNWNGTVVREWGKADDVGVYVPEKSLGMTFAPIGYDVASLNPVRWLNYLAFRETEEFRDRVRGFNYDRHFSPDARTYTYYSSWAMIKGLVPVEVEEEKLCDMFGDERVTIHGTHAHLFGAEIANGSKAARVHLRAFSAKCLYVYYSLDVSWLARLCDLCGATVRPFHDGSRTVYVIDLVRGEDAVFLKMVLADYLDI